MKKEGLLDLLKLHSGLEPFFHKHNVNSIQDINTDLLEEFFFDYDINPLMQLKILNEYEELVSTLKEDVCFSESELVTKDNQTHNDGFKKSASEEVRSDSSFRDSIEDVEANDSPVEKKDRDSLNEQKLIDNTNLSVRAKNALTRNGITTLNQLSEMGLNDILSFRNIGKKTVKEISLLIEKLKVQQEDFYPIDRLFIDEIVLSTQNQIEKLMSGYWITFDTLDFENILDYLKSKINQQNNPIIYRYDELAKSDGTRRRYEPLFDYIYSILQQEEMEDFPVFSFSLIDKEDDFNSVTNNNNNDGDDNDEDFKEFIEDAYYE